MDNTIVCILASMYTKLVSMHTLVLVVNSGVTYATNINMKH